MVKNGQCVQEERLLGAPRLHDLLQPGQRLYKVLCTRDRTAGKKKWSLSKKVWCMYTVHITFSCLFLNCIWVFTFKCVFFGPKYKSIRLDKQQFLCPVGYLSVVSGRYRIPVCERPDYFKVWCHNQCWGARDGVKVRLRLPAPAPP